MSVGRINLTNFKNADNEMCWVNGFIKLSDNKHLRAQLKDLDRYRSKQLSTLLKTTRGIEVVKSKLPRVKIAKTAFVTIPGFSEKDSEIVRHHLVKSGILTKRYRLNNGVNLDDEGLALGLDEEYATFRNDIIELLKNPVNDKRDVYYGKPFSYYYHVILTKGVRLCILHLTTRRLVFRLMPCPENLELNMLVRCTMY